MDLPFWQRSLSTLTFEHLKDFVRLRLPEGEHIEYKAASRSTDSPKPNDFDDKFLATIPAFANGGGGILLYGVHEGKPGRPHEIVGDPPDNGAPRELTKSIVAICAARIEPTLNLHTKAFIIPRDEPNPGNQVVIIRVDDAMWPPYNLTTQGIYVRGGKDGDRRAGVAEIERLIGMRRNLPAQPQIYWRNVTDKVFIARSGKRVDYSPILMVAVTPRFPIDAILLNESADDYFERICRRIQLPEGDPPILDPTGVVYKPSDRDIRRGKDVAQACAYIDGSIGACDLLSYDLLSQGERPEILRINIVEMWTKLTKMLQELVQWPRDLGSYDGPLTCHIGLGNLAGCMATLPRDMEVMSSYRIRRRDTPNTDPGWSQEETWESDIPAVDFIEPFVGSLARQMQFGNFDRFKADLRSAVADCLR